MRVLPAESIISIALAHILASVLKLLNSNGKGWPGKLEERLCSVVCKSPVLMTFRSPCSLLGWSWVSTVESCWLAWSIGGNNQIIRITFALCNMKRSAIFDESSKLSADAFFRNSTINQWKITWFLAYFSTTNYFWNISCMTAWIAPDLISRAFWKWLIFSSQDPQIHSFHLRCEFPLVYYISGSDWNGQSPWWKGLTAVMPKLYK